ncbi:mannose-6-phosphate isomerase-like protein (cupin superfamily) [Aureibacter tunicatorum]|uniref:Mannose-6-phosphate isomerase-like protein (Cupin superfamily) n=2 Tax=Aureibacter tunicatorum TaxID=866807 RepID=A0AAE4BTY2_9BACT|nr:mannose-6-phosphate isomerase-like protein (cupin superfamily) [Aureibacter tunicatorum]BDD05705.1 mannose-6-phosphate isomerase [Aureibacter tunicatorum]
MEIKKISIADKMSLFDDHWNPRIVGELNGQHVKLVKAQGEFEWHKHDNEDEMFLVIEGEFDMELRDKTITIKKGEFIIIPRGVEHRPVVENEVQVMLFEPANTINTGQNEKSDLTQEKTEWI